MSEEKGRVSILEILPTEIGQLERLEELSITNTSLTALPSEIGQLVNLKELYLQHNQLKVLPPEIGQLMSLEKVFLSVNNLIALPKEISQLSSLKQLYLQNNQLSSLFHIPMISSPIVSLSCESNLEVLALSGNKEPMILDDCICDLDIDNGGTLDIDIVKKYDLNNPNPLVKCQGDVIGK